MPMPASYQPKKKPVHVQEFFKDAAPQPGINNTTRKNSSRLFHQKFFIALGLIIFLYTCLRISEHIEKYNENPKFLNDITQTVHMFKNIKTNHAYASDASKPQTPKAPPSTPSKEGITPKSETKDKSNISTNKDAPLTTDQMKENSTNSPVDEETKKMMKNLFFLIP